MNPFLKASGRHSVSTEPRDDESFIGYIFRLAKRRDMTTAALLASKIGMPAFLNWPTEENLSRLSADSGVPIDRLRWISCSPKTGDQATFRGQAVSMGLVKGQVGVRTVCPPCLAESPHHRSYWDLTHVEACPMHAVGLVWACAYPACGRRLGWQGADLTRCRCGADLTQAPCSPIDPDLLDGTMAVHGLLGDQRFAAQAEQALSAVPLRDLRPVEAVEFIIRVGLDIAPGVERKKLFSLEHAMMLDDPPYVALHLGLQAAHQWPETFLHIPEIIQAKRSPSSSIAHARWERAVQRWLGGIETGRGIAIREALETTALRRLEREAALGS